MASGGVISGATKGRGGPALARHLADLRREPQNDATRLGATRGLMADSIKDAIAELTHMVSHVRSSQPIYHVHLDPEQPWTQTQRDRYWFLFEREFGFENRPFAEAVHIKNGREHYHRAYSRVRRDGTVISISHDYARREKVGRIAELEFGGRHIAGRHNKAATAALRRDGRMDVVKSIEAAGLMSMPRPEARMTPRQRHQAVRTGLDPTEVAVIALRIWQEHATDALVREFALEGLWLCEGDKGPVLVDLAGGVHSLTRTIGKASAAAGHRIRAADIKTRMANIDLRPLSDEGGQYHDRKDPTENFSDLDASADAKAAEKRSQRRTSRYPRSAGEVYRSARAESDRRSNAPHVREFREDAGSARPVAHPTAWRADQSRKNPDAAGGFGAIQRADPQRAGQSRRATGRNRTADHRVEWLLGEPEFSPAIDRLVMLTDVLDPGVESRLQWEDLRAELVLCEADFEPALNMLGRIIHALLVLIGSVVELLFGAPTANDPISRQAAELDNPPHPSPSNVTV